MNLSSWKNLLSTLPVFLLSVTSYPQVKINDKALYKITYRMVHHYDTTERARAFDEKMDLVVGDKTSWFRSAGADQYAKDFTAQKQQRMLDIKNGTGRPIIPLKRPIGTQIFLGYSSNEAVICEELLNAVYLMTDTIAKSQWIIFNENKTIGNLICQKAIGKVKGRTYISWFYPGIPVQAGPWYLGGLPGLILQATDERNEVEFLFDGLEDIKGNNLSIQTPQKFIPISRKDWKKLLSTYQEDPIQFMINQNAQHGVSTTVAGLPPQNGKRKNPVNNPMDLSNK